MNGKELFPDYEPKTTPDTVEDYLNYPKSEIFKILGEIGEVRLEHLKEILILFKKYQKEAKKNPGRFQDGRVSLGANLKQYTPSEEELIVSELGKMINKIIEIHSEKEINEYKKKEKIKSQIIEFIEIYFRHVDVMGSGRYFYAEKNEKKIKIRL
ncbi:MAG: hypothetical protein ACFE8M_07495 [Candidatus Hermodarchaeota archaeon]